MKTTKTDTSSLKRSTISKRSSLKADNSLNVYGKDPNYHYAWLNFDEMKDQGFADHSDYPYQIVSSLNQSSESSVDDNSIDSNKGPDGMIRRGDLVLAKMTKEMKEKRDAWEKSKRDNQISGITEYVEGEQRRDGVERKLNYDVTRGIQI